MKNEIIEALKKIEKSPKINVTNMIADKAEIVGTYNGKELKVVFRLSGDYVNTLLAGYQIGLKADVYFGGERMIWNADIPTAEERKKINAIVDRLDEAMKAEHGITVNDLYRELYG